MTITLLILLILAELWFSPRLDLTEDKTLLLWYYDKQNKRKYLKVITL
jgi:hypothetical protein